MNIFRHEYKNVTNKWIISSIFNLCRSFVLSISVWSRIIVIFIDEKYIIIFYWYHPITLERYDIAELLLKFPLNINQSINQPITLERYDIAEILLKFPLNINQSISQSTDYIGTKCRDNQIDCCSSADVTIWS